MIFAFDVGRFDLLQVVFVPNRRGEAVREGVGQVVREAVLTIATRLRFAVFHRAEIRLERIGELVGKTKFRSHALEVFVLVANRKTAEKIISPALSRSVFSEQAVRLKKFARVTDRETFVEIERRGEDKTRVAAIVLPAVVGTRDETDAKF